ncbi:MAG TPA: HDOD domain-containing protein [Chloroflexota bacterium]|nr:HDOD domain-containing protein [Chloroflexota bacterium]
MANELDVQEVLDNASDAVPRPDTATANLQRSSQTDTSGEEIFDLMKTDPALTARVLRIVNSAFYGPLRQITDIDNAVMLLGQKTIRNLVPTATMDRLSAQGVKGYGIGKGGLFGHSLVVAQSAQVVS